MQIVGAIVCYQTGDIWMLIIARAVWGVGDASFFCIGMTYVSSLFPSEKRGRALGLFQAVEMTGSFLGQTAGGFLAGAYGLRSNFLASVVIGVAALAVVLLVKGNDYAGSAGSLRSILPSRAVLKSILGRTILAACLINLVCMAMNSGLMGTLFPLYATEQLGLEPRCLRTSNQLEHNWEHLGKPNRRHCLGSIWEEGEFFPLGSLQVS